MAHPLTIVRLQLLPHSQQQENRSVDAHRHRLYAILTAVRQRFDCYVNLYFPAALNPTENDGSAFFNLIGGLRETVFSRGPKQVERGGTTSSGKIPFISNLRMIYI